MLLRENGALTEFVACIGNADLNYNSTTCLQNILTTMENNLDPCYPILTLEISLLFISKSSE